MNIVGLNVVSNEGFRNMSTAFTYKVQAREMRKYAALCQEKSSFRVKIDFGSPRIFFCSSVARAEERFGVFLFEGIRTDPTTFIVFSTH